MSSKYFAPALNATREFVKRLDADQDALEGVVQGHVEGRDGARAQKGPS